MIDHFSRISLIGESSKPFTGKEGFRTYSWRSYNIISEISKTEAFYVLRTNVRISRFLECKKLELFLHGLDNAEFEAVLSFPGVLADPLFIQSLRAKSFLLSGRTYNSDRLFLLRERVQLLRSALGLTRWDENLLYAYLGNLKYELFQTEERIRKVIKYSGYIKTPSAAGSKRSSNLGEEYSAETSYLLKFEEKDLFDFLTSPTEDYSLLGFDPGSPLYQTFSRYLKERKELPHEMKPFLLYQARNF